jgi:hypothetical protein
MPTTQPISIFKHKRNIQWCIKNKQRNQNGFGSFHIEKKTFPLNLVFHLAWEKMDEKMLVRKMLEVSNEQWPDAAHWKSTTRQHIQTLVENAMAVGHDILNEVDHGDKHLHKYKTIPIYYAIFHGAKLNVVQYMAKTNLKGTIDWRSDDGSTLLHIAAWKNRHEDIPFLLSISPEWAAVTNDNGISALDLAINYNSLESEHHLTDVASTVEHYTSSQTKVVATKERNNSDHLEKQNVNTEELNNGTNCAEMVTSLRVDGHNKWGKTTLEHVKSLLASQDEEVDGSYPQLSVIQGGWLPIVNAIMFGASSDIVQFLYEKTGLKEKIKNWRGSNNRTLLYYAIYDVRNHHLIKWIVKTFPEYLTVSDEKTNQTPSELFESSHRGEDGGADEFQRNVEILRGAQQ